MERTMSSKSQDHVVQSEALVKIGNIFVYSWGYGQTNIEWFKVVGLTKTGKSAKFQKVEGCNVYNPQTMTGKTTPNKDKFAEGSQAITKRLKEYEGEILARMDYGHLRQWDGKPESYSTYA